MKFAYLLIVSLVIIVSCNNEGGNAENGVQDVQGMIVYDITYLQDESENSLISLLPDSMIYMFKNNSIVQIIEGWGKVFTMMGIVDYEKGTNSALLKVLGKKYHFETPLTSDESFGFDLLNGMEIEYIENETKEISGFLCKKAIVHFTDTVLQSPIEVFYTEDIKIENPNRNNPFKEIPGVLMEYQMSFQRIPMVMKFKYLENIKVKDSEFQVPDDFTKVSKDEMQQFINTLI
jgi:GLPGLI family protein